MFGKRRGRAKESGRDGAGVSVNEITQAVHSLALRFDKVTGSGKGAELAQGHAERGGRLYGAKQP